jgi:hypothetical protein
METIELSRKYAVMQQDKQVGVITANNYSHASKKAQQLFNRHVYVERLS